MRDKGKRVSLTVILVAALAAWLALPATASANQLELQKAKKSFGQAWSVVQSNYFPLSLQTRGLVEACNAVNAIDDAQAKATAIQLLDSDITGAMEIVGLYATHRAVLERRAGAILRAARDIEPAKKPDVAQAQKKLLDAIDLLVDDARQYLSVALGFIQKQSCAPATISADQADSAVNRAAKLKVKAFKLL